MTTSVNTETTTRRRITREQAAALWAQADQAADEALRWGDPVALPPMSACERRVVHDRLLVRPQVRTCAQGEEPERHVVVTPV